MEDEDYRIMVLNDTTIKCFRDGRIFTICKNSNKYGKKGEWIERTTKTDSNGYIHIGIGRKMYFAHRLIMLAFIGDSDQQVDHINRIKTDNRFENLRYCTNTENSLNREFVDTAKGYSWHKNKWQARICINFKHKHLGSFDNEQDARQAYVEACTKYRNEL